MNEKSELDKFIGFDIDEGIGSYSINPESPAANENLLTDFTTDLGSGIETALTDPQSLPIVQGFQDLLNQKGQSTIVPDLDDSRSFGQQTADAVLRAPFPLLQAENLSRKTLGAGSPVTTGIESFNSNLPFNFGEEFQAGLDTAADFLTGNIYDSPDGDMWDDLIDQYRHNRDFRREVLDRASEKNPKAATSGKLLSLLPKLPLFYNKPISGGFIIGALEEMGISKKDLSDPSLYKDGLNTGVLMSLIGASSQALRGLSKTFLPKKLNDIAGFSRIAGGGDPTNTKVLVNPNQPLPREVVGFQQARDAGFLKIVNNRVTQPSTSIRIPSVKEIITNPKQAFLSANITKESAWQYAKNVLRLKKSDIDYPLLQKQMNNSLSTLGEAKLELLSKHLGNKKYSISDVFPAGAGKRTQRLIDNISEIQDDFQKFNVSASGSEVRAMRQMSSILQRESLSAIDLNDLKSSLGIIVKKSLNKQLPSGAMRDTVDDFHELQRFLKSELNSVKAGAGTNFADIDNKLSNFSAFSEHVDDGALKHFNNLARGEQYEKGLVTRVLQSPDTNVGGSGNIPLSGILGMGVNVAEKTLGLTLGAVGSAFKIPALTNFTYQSLFKSWDGKKIRSNQDKALARHYIESNNKLSSTEKLKRIHSLSENGQFSLDNLSDDIKEYAKNKLQEEQDKALGNM